MDKYYEDCKKERQEIYQLIEDICNVAEIDKHGEATLIIPGIMTVLSALLTQLHKYNATDFMLFIKLIILFSPIKEATMNVLTQKHNNN